jgi:hypothetical protein
VRFRKTGHQVYDKRRNNPPFARSAQHIGLAILPRKEATNNLVVEVRNYTQMSGLAPIVCSSPLEKALEFYWTNMCLVSRSFRPCAQALSNSICKTSGTQKSSAVTTAPTLKANALRVLQQQRKRTSMQRNIHALYSYNSKLPCH